MRVARILLLALWLPCRRPGGGGDCRPVASSRPRKTGSGGSTSRPQCRPARWRRASGGLSRCRRVGTSRWAPVAWSITLAIGPPAGSSSKASCSCSPIRATKASGVFVGGQSLGDTESPAYTALLLRKDGSATRRAAHGRCVTADRRLGGGRGRRTPRRQGRREARVPHRGRHGGGDLPRRRQEGRDDSPRRRASRRPFRPAHRPRRQHPRRPARLHAATGAPEDRQARGQAHVSQRTGQPLRPKVRHGGLTPVAR